MANILSRTKVIAFLIAWVLACAAYADIPDSTASATTGKESQHISTFKERFSLRFLTNYNFVSVINDKYDKGPLISNKPVGIGAGFNIDSLFTLFGTSWGFGWDFKFTLPFTTSDGKSETVSGEIGVDLFPSDFWINLNFSGYGGFTATKNGEDYFMDLWILDTYASVLWMATANGKFSPRSAYYLDRRQAESAGSLILGGRFENNYTIDLDSTLDYKNHFRDIYFSWIDIGYTYSWVYHNGMFLNLWSVIGFAYGWDNNSDKHTLSPEFDGRAAFGYHGKKWSWNTVLKAGYSFIHYKEYLEHKFVSSLEILVVRRF